MAGMATKTLLTIEQYRALSEDPPGLRYELSDGELIVTPSSSYFHNEIRDEFNGRLRTFVKPRRLGIVISETDVQLDETTVRRPDVAFIHRERLQGEDLGRMPLAVAPSLVVEIVSPSDRASDLMKKVFQYLEAGAQAVWLLYPDVSLAYRYRPNKLEPEVFSKEHDFSEPELLPGFVLPLAEIFSSRDADIG
jgi:Uma2 family endonuclease